MSVLSAIFQFQCQVPMTRFRNGHFICRVYKGLIPNDLLLIFYVNSQNLLMSIHVIVIIIASS